MWNVVSELSVCAKCFYISSGFSNSVSVKYVLHENITILSSLVHGFFNYTTSGMVNFLHDAELDKRQRKTFQRLDDTPDFSSKSSSWEIKNITVTRNPESMLQFS